MPRAQLSPEEKVLQFFTDAPIQVAAVILRLATTTVRTRILAENKRAGRPRPTTQAMEARVEPLQPPTREQRGNEYPEPPPLTAPAASKAPKPRSRRRMSASSTPPVRQDVAETQGSVEEAEPAEIDMPGVQMEVGDDDELNQATPE